MTAYLKAGIVPFENDYFGLIGVTFSFIFLDVLNGKIALNAI
jgi:hypothetical protein